MDEKGYEQKEAPVVVIMERRRQRETELSSAEVMKILRKRSARALRIPR